MDIVWSICKQYANKGEVMTKELFLILFLPVFMVIVGMLLYTYIYRSKTKKIVVALSKIEVSDILEKQKKIHSFSNLKKSKDLKMRLIQAGITLKEYNEAKFLFLIMAIIIGGILPFFLPTMISVMIVLIAVLMVIFSGEIYIALAKGERVKKVNNDLGVFLDLINIILEAGGSLKNAFNQVATKARGIISDDLLKEISILEYEMSNYSTKIAYENLKERVDSREMDKIIDFLILSEETGVGVKTVFAMQSEDIRKNKFFEIKGKVSTLNMYLMLVIFIFVMPALGAFVVFPMMAGKISVGI